MDIYLVTMVLNWLWYIFSILFILYRFTSFFSYIYGFLRFLGKLFEGVIYIKNQSYNYINPNYSIVNADDSDLEQGELYVRNDRTVLQKVRDTWNGLFSSGYNINTQNVSKPLIPLVTTTRESYFKPNLRDSSTMTFDDSNYFLHTNTHSKENIDNNLNIHSKENIVNLSKFNSQNAMPAFNKHLSIFIKDSTSTISNINAEVDDFQSVGCSEAVNDWINNEKIKNSKTKLPLNNSLDDSFEL